LQLGPHPLAVSRQGTSRARAAGGRDPSRRV